jgi:hypothetical protein
MGHMPSPCCHPPGLLHHPLPCCLAGCCSQHCWSHCCHCRHSLLHCCRCRPAAACLLHLPTQTPGHPDSRPWSRLRRQSACSREAPAPAQGTACPADSRCPKRPVRCSRMHTPGHPLSGPRCGQSRRRPVVVQGIQHAELEAGSNKVLHECQHRMTVVYGDHGARHQVQLNPSEPATGSGRQIVVHACIIRGRTLTSQITTMHASASCLVCMLAPSYNSITPGHGQRKCLMQIIQTSS